VVIPAALQALDVLSDPRHPDLVAQLRVAAAAISKQNSRKAQAWLEGGLFNHLLDILRALPSLSLGPTDAAEICAGAAAGIGNILHVAAYDPAVELATRTTLEQMMLAARSRDVLTALIHHGILAPAAAEQLPPGHEVHVEADSDDGSVNATLEGGFWTPLRICAFTLSVRLRLHTCADHQRRAKRPLLAALADARIVRLMLHTAIAWPCGESTPAVEVPTTA
jgi:hypothetical protein